MSDLNDIYDALRVAERLAEFQYRHARHSDDYQEARDNAATARRGMAAYDRVASGMPRMQALEKAADDAYDRYVEDPSSWGCSCHISAPCSYCTREVADE